MAAQELILIPTDGLCNRLRAIAAAKRLGVELGMKISVVWQWGNWGDLFALDDSLTVLSGLSEDEQELPKISTLLAKDGGGRSNQQLDLPMEPRFILKTGHIFSVARCAPATPVSLRDFYPKPSAVVTEIVDEFVTEHFTQPTVGIHIRRTDNTESQKRSPDELFLNAVSELVTEKKQVFLGTDNPETRRQFKQKFGPSIVERVKFNDEAIRWPRAQSTIVDVCDDWIDLLLLSRCDYVLGSGYSSFSDTAISLNGDGRSRILRV